MRKCLHITNGDSAIPVMREAGVIGELMPEIAPLLQVEGQKAFEMPECYPYPESFTKQRLSLTSAGEEVLQGKADWLNLHQLDRWYGGVRLRPDNIWRWDERKKTIISE